MASILKAGLIINVQLIVDETSGETPIIPFAIVHNAKGTALVNWTVGKMSPNEDGSYCSPLSEADYELSELGNIKLHQLSHLSVIGYEDSNTYVHQVVEGKIRTIEEKITKIVTDAEDGSRHLIVVEDEDSAAFFYSGLGLMGAGGQPLPQAAQAIKEGQLNVLPPYKICEFE